MPHQQKTKYTESDILDPMDKCAEEFNFPILNNINSHLADIKLTSFRSSEEWLIVFEEVALFEETMFMNTVSAYGNKVRTPGVQLGIDDIIKPVPSRPIFDDEGMFTLNLFDFEIKINNKKKHFSPTKADYQKLKIKLQSKVPDAAKLLRYLVDKVPEEFFVSESKLLQICGRRSANVKLFLKLDDWNHPDVADDELPSESISFKTLADALVQGDPGLYSCPKNKENTHWTNWKSLLI